jgi:hypothetical protein
MTISYIYFETIDLLSATFKDRHPVYNNYLQN